jgi:hypothetical protein
VSAVAHQAVGEKAEGDGLTRPHRELHSLQAAANDVFLDATAVEEGRLRIGLQTHSSASRRLRRASANRQEGRMRGRLASPCPDSAAPPATPDFAERIFLAAMDMERPAKQTKRCELNRIELKVQ